MSGNSWKVRQPGNRIRTRKQSLDTSGAVLDLTWLGHGVDAVSVTVREASGTVEVRGSDVLDDWIDIGAGIELVIDFSVASGNLPSFRASTGTAELDILVSAYVRA